ncbi:MAG TPA: RNA methyltransferase [Gemmatimonadaceae bacterium]|jgi:TrmH family RNA methyltransferase
MNLLTLARDLRRRKARERQGLFVAEGVRAVEEVLRSGLAIRGALVSDALRETPRGAALLTQLEQRNIATLEVGEADFQTAAETDSPQGVLTIGAAPDLDLASVPVAESLRLLVLDAVQDPGNAGTILRTAAALGAAATVAMPGTVDLWNAKVVRSAMGAHFHHSCLTSTWDELDSFRQQHAVEIWAADAEGELVDRLTPPARLALVVGNEGAGLSSHARARADRLVALPISAAVESLNVAVATGILLYELRG